MSFELLLLIYDPLVRLRYGIGPPALSGRKLGVSDDQLNWTFHLAEGVTWHDGEPFTSRVREVIPMNCLPPRNVYVCGYNEGITEITVPTNTPWS